ncbi:mannose-6-phosphate isomerase 1-like isoform X1 [Telopea speciosissima]|uniref:mannose-6-phosphate isomerase 1-like isoform X1 n=1 Tax=Telopea speciosissima TaxID=54955 RepID=UPI001CC66381|nr:mannose-6-phosphate isomerase 1-like isoform X1 [Telopea speciosissima]
MDEVVAMKAKIVNEPVRLGCFVQNYDWGRIGEDSKVASLFSLNSGLEIEPSKPYAEIWMGTHPSGPSFVVENGELDGGSSGFVSKTLKSWISENPSVLGDKVVKKWGNNLPFLFKVLSVAKALSIQAHPDKELARVLNKSKPKLYRDDNHKPEMALALTEFEALCGFVSVEELKDVLHDVPEIIDLVGNAEADEVLHINEQYGEKKIKTILRSIFTQLMTVSENAISEAVFKMKRRLNIEKKVRYLTDKEQLVLRLEKQYPSDIGVMSAFFLNYVKLNPGEALYLGANEPHAYISGECIECMATSDNVVRAGLTPKYRDVQTLCSMLTYKQGSPGILHGFLLNPYTKRYLPPFDEFEVDHCIFPQGTSAILPVAQGPSLFLVTAGEGTMQTSTGLFGEMISEGSVLFVPANTEIMVTTIEGMQLYRAGVNSKFLSENQVEEVPFLI